MTELDIYKLVVNILNDMDKEELYDGYTLSIFKERFEREFNYYIVELGNHLIDEFNNRKEEEKMYVKDSQHSLKNLLYDRLGEINSELVNQLKSEDLLTKDDIIKLIEDDKYFIERLINICVARKRF